MYSLCLPVEGEWIDKCFHGKRKGMSEPQTYSEGKFGAGFAVVDLTI